LARSAMFSKFHFSRVLQRVTGVTSVGSRPLFGWLRPGDCC
jgi:hypothetical protein